MHLILSHCLVVSHGSVLGLHFMPAVSFKINCNLLTVEMQLCYYYFKYE